MRVNLEAVLQEKERDKQGDQKLVIFEVKPGDIVFVAQRFL